MKLTITGHRPPKLIGGYDIMIFDKNKDLYRPHVSYIWVRDQLSRMFDALQPELVYSGMALGVDQWGAELCVEKGIPFVASLAFEGQEKVWPKKSQDTFNKLLSQAKKVVNVSQIVPPKKKNSRNEMYYNRDCWMVDQGDEVLCVFDGSHSGTKLTVDYAKKISRKVHVIDANKKPLEK